MTLIKSIAYLLAVVSGLIFSVSISYAVSTQKDGCSADSYPNSRVQFINERVGWIIGPHLFHTTDGGATWTAIRYKNCIDMIRSRDGPEYRKHYVQFVDEIWGWRKSPIDDNSVQFTVDGGNHWVRARTSTPASLSSVRFVNASRGWAVGGYPRPIFSRRSSPGAVIETVDGGKSWKQVTFR
jgi:photosystem II stability/assembly factor-like uncharacterized protein